MEDKLPILAIETSDELCSVAVMIDKITFFEGSIKKKHVHSEKLINLIEAVLKLADLEVKDLKTVAISEGPGSFTGLRIGMAAAKGIAIPHNMFFVSVPTIDAMALQISSYVQSGDSFAVVNNVNRDEVYFAKFVKENKEVKNVMPLKIIDRDDVEKELNENEIVYGSYRLNQDNYNLAAPDARFIALWSYKYGKELVTKEYDYIEPNYLKKFVVRGQNA